jgi:hypothetical protein
VITRLAPLLLLVLIAAWPSGSKASATGEIFRFEIRIPGQPEPLHIAPADADAFQRRLNSPPPYAGPLPQGESFVITSGYWDATFGVGVGAPPVQPRALYFRVDGIVAVQRAADDDVYYVLDQRQRAMLNRYIRLATAGAIPPDPGALDVLAAASRDEPIIVEIAGKRVDDALARALWAELNMPTMPGAVGFLGTPRPPAGEEGYWITFTTSEGRALQYHYNPSTGALVDSLGTESYTFEDRVLPATTGEPLQLLQQPPQGSKLWWPLMLGGGIALLGAAVWLQRRSG